MTVDNKHIHIFFVFQSTKQWDVFYKNYRSWSSSFHQPIQKFKKQGSECCSDLYLYFSRQCLKRNIITNKTNIKTPYTSPNSVITKQKI
jgi:hypothetical protein